MEESSKRIESLDVLRGIAVLLVIAVHSYVFSAGSTWFHDFSSSYGTFGVQLFFIISGYTMMLTGGSRVSRQDVVSFYIRRFFRIAPLFWIAETLYVLKNGLGHGYWAPTGITGQQILLTATFTQFLSPTAVNTVVPGSWSIMVEMQFYALFPLALVVFLQRGPRTFIPYLIIFAISVAARLVRAPLNGYLQAHLAPNEADLADFFQDWWLPNQLLCFGFGFLLFNWMEKRVLSFTGLAALTLVALSSPWGTTVFFLFLLAFFVLTTRVRIPILSRIGIASYSVYLIHFAVIDVILHFWRRWPGTAIPEEAGFLATAVISTALSLLIVKPFVEDPSIRLGKRLAQRFRASDFSPPRRQPG